jgi:hypothetical protein
VRIFNPTNYKYVYGEKGSCEEVYENKQAVKKSLWKKGSCEEMFMGIREM